MHQESKQQYKMHLNSRTGNMAIINNPIRLLVAKSRSVGCFTKNECARTSHHVGFDRQSHDSD